MDTLELDSYHSFQEYLKGMRNLEDKLAETEQRLAEYQLGHDAANSEEHAVIFFKLFFFCFNFSYFVFS